MVVDYIHGGFLIPAKAIVNWEFLGQSGLQLGSKITLNESIENASLS